MGCLADSERGMIGLMRERIEIQRPVETASAEGQPVKTWVKVIGMWARAESLTGREMDVLKQINSEISRKFTVNYRKDLLPTDDQNNSPLKMRVRWNDTSFNIHDIQADENRFDLMIYTSRVK
jgi:SPP1 family predicted phage head-tail adaptor